MKARPLTICLLLAAGMIGTGARAQSLHAAPPNTFAWGENIGYLNWGDAGAPGGGEAARFYFRPAGGFFKGFVWCENVGWINLGNGNGPYANGSGVNFGVNANLSGTLSGFAWGENVGWINFGGGASAAPAQPARIDFVSSRVRGFAWGENIGWINLDHAGVYVGLEAGCPCDLNFDGMVDDADFSIFIVAYDMLDCGELSMPAGCPSDFNGDNFVNDEDFSVFIVAYDAMLCD